MATVIWTESAQAEKREFYRQGFLEFGRTIANKTNQKIEAIENDLAKHPKVGYLEPLLKSAAIQYRSKHINKRYKLIYRYEESSDIVYIEDIWDTRRAPQNLTKRITNKE
jgi:plasmid stabilization system protein ParE